MNKVLLIGHCGSIGKRYKAILEYYNIEVLGFDIKEKGSFNLLQYDVDGVIIASPTIWHREHLHEVRNKHVPILCEKPMCETIEQAESVSTNPDFENYVSIVDNWVHLLGGYFKDYIIQYKTIYTGNEALAFNLAQLIYLTSESGWLDCIPNRPMFSASVLEPKTHRVMKTVNSFDLDMSYVNMIEKWLKTGKTNFGLKEGLEIQRAVEKFKKGDADWVQICA